MSQIKLALPLGKYLYEVTHVVFTNWELRFEFEREKFCNTNE